MPELMEELELELLRETPAAFLVTDGETECWLPKSQIRVVDREGKMLTVWVPEWLARNEGLI